MANHHCCKLEEVPRILDMYIGFKSSEYCWKILKAFTRMKNGSPNIKKEILAISNLHVKLQKDYSQIPTHVKLQTLIVHT